MSQSFLAGFLFAVAGFALLLAQVATIELSRGYRRLRDTINTHFGHDTSIYPDYEQQS